MTAEQLLEQAASIIVRRRHTYGLPHEQFERVATRWSQVLGITVTPAQVVLCLIDLKVVRIAHNPRHLDSITDVAGYAGVLAELASDA
jgi:Domain of unknown function (DUF6378)